MDKEIVMLGCFDTKGEDFSFLFECLKQRNQQVITINTGVMETVVDFPIDFDNESVASASGMFLQSIRENGDRGRAVEFMGKGAAAIISDLVIQKRVKGIIGMGGGGGTFIALAGMQAVPLGIPKFCLSTLAAKDLSRQIGIKDITLMSSVVDIAGVNSLSKLFIEQAASAICGMTEISFESNDDGKKRIAISIFGNTTRCVDMCTEILRKKGFEVLAFHATGIGGATMESLIREGFFDGVLDITTTELADDLCGGICSAGADRLTAASEMGIPQIVVPGCLDMVNFTHRDTIPEKYKSRQFFSWAPDVTLMRTSIEENELLGKQLAAKLNLSKGLVKILLPLQGISQLDCKEGVFYDPDADRSLFDAIKRNIEDSIEIVQVDAHINDKIFAETLVAYLLRII